MILVDSSIWIDHFRRGDALLREWLEAGEVLVHPFVIGELACGLLRDRHVVLKLLRRLPFAPLASDEEAHALLERRDLNGRGIGWIDVHLLAATAIASAKLFTRDRRLATVADELGLGA